MCKCRMGAARGRVVFDPTDPQTVGLMVVGAIGANLVVNPIMGAINKSGKLPAQVKPALKVALGYLAITKQSNAMLQDVGAGAVVMGAIELINGLLPDSFRNRLAADTMEGVGTTFDLSNYSPTTYQEPQGVAGAGVI